MLAQLYFSLQKIKHLSMNTLLFRTLTELGRKDNQLKSSISKTLQCKIIYKKMSKKICLCNRNAQFWSTKLQSQKGCVYSFE